jgi:glycosyltransferase involved in cell wall biosynthesis
VRVLYHHRTQGGRVEAVHIRGIVDGLRGMGHTVELVGPPATAAGDGGKPSPAGQALRFAARRLPQSGFELLELAYNGAGYPRGLKAARAQEAEILYERAAAYACAGALVSRRLGMPLVVEFNDVAGQSGVRRHRFARLARRLEAFVLRQADAAIVVTSYLRDELCARGMDADRIAVIANGVDARCFRPEIDGRSVRRRFGIDDAECVVGFCGAMSSWYRLDEVVTAFAAAFAGRPRMRLLLIGDGPEREAVQRRIDEAACGEQVVIGARVPHEAVPEHLAAFDIALIPHCNAHGSPVKLFEYLGMAKPVVAVRTAGVTDIVTHEREALLADAGDLRGVMACVARLADDRAGAQAMARRGYQRVLAHHTWQRNAERTFAVLERAQTVRRGQGARWIRDMTDHQPPTTDHRPPAEAPPAALAMPERG